MLLPVSLSISHLSSSSLVEEYYFVITRLSLALTHGTRLSAILLFYVREISEL